MKRVCDTPKARLVGRANPSTPHRQQFREFTFGVISLLLLNETITNSRKMIMYEVWNTRRNRKIPIGNIIK
jgi:hypothetical protein